MKKNVFTAILACACIVSGVAQTTKRTEDASWDIAVNDPAAKYLARPTKVQYDWQEMERAMFVQIDPATIQGESMIMVLQRCKTSGLKSLM